MLEGPHLVAEAVAAGLRFATILATAEYLSREAPASVREHPRLIAVTPDVIASVGDAETARDVVAAAILPRSGVDSLPRIERGVYIYADGLQDPGNLGALARVAEASGATALVLGPGSVHPNHPRALRGSAGSLLRLPVAIHATPDDIEAHLEALAPRWVALTPRDGASLWEAPLEGTLVLAVGAEGPGLSPAIESRAALQLTIPLASPVESLNATVAAALVLFEIARRRTGAVLAPTFAGG